MECLFVKMDDTFSRPLRRVTAATLLTLASSLFWSTPASAADESAYAAALRFVEEQQVGRNLPMMARKTISNTVTYRGMVSNLGQSKADRYVETELAGALPKYQPRWNETLAASYSKFFSADELDSLRREGKSSLVVPKLTRVWDELGREMKEQGASILVAYTSEALNAAFKKSADDGTR